MKKVGAYKKKNAPAPEESHEDTRGGLGAIGIENWVLQNGGSFIKAAKDFMSVAEKCESLSEFQNQYAIWDFGENHMSSYKDIYPHDNFVYNMTEEGYKKIKVALGSFLGKSQEKGKISIEELVSQDPSVLNDSPYMHAVKTIMDKYAQLLDRMGEI